MIWATFRIALRAIARNLVRSFLTTLGVVIGTAAVIATVAIGQGATASVKAQLSSMGQNMLVIVPGSSSSGAMMMGAGSVQTLTANDARSLEELDSVRALAVVVRARAQLVYGSENWAPSTLFGTEPDYLRVRDWHVDEGEPFSDADVKAAAQVCMLGRTVVKELFGQQDPVGQRIRIKGLPFRVVGVLARKGANAFGADQDDIVLLPWTTARKKVSGSAFASTVDEISVSARSSEVVGQLQREATDVLRANHRIGRDSRGEFEDDFTVRDMSELVKAVSSTSTIMTMLLGAVASISLLVGGVGIMNIMLVSVTERTREIGLRMAVGARDADILAQFLVEALVLSGLGGVLGIALGGGGALAVASVARWPVSISPVAVLVAVSFSVLVGVVFGFYPAWRASRLDPIDALRYE